MKSFIDLQQKDLADELTDAIKELAVKNDTEYLYYWDGEDEEFLEILHSAPWEIFLSLRECYHKELKSEEERKRMGDVPDLEDACTFMNEYQDELWLFADVADKELMNAFKVAEKVASGAWQIIDVTNFEELGRYVFDECDAARVGDFGEEIRKHFDFHAYGESIAENELYVVTVNGTIYKADEE